MREFTAVFKQEEGWWIGWVEELPGANAQERTLEEARSSLREAVRDILDVNRELADGQPGNQHLVRETLTIDAA
jgi:predicted RNase H-like HicB family nuclease